MARHAAALFDLDGTLLDTEALCNETGIAACKELGHDVPLRFFEGLAGIHDAERVRLISDYVGAPVSQEAFYEAWDRLTSARYAAEGVPMKEGTYEVLAALRKAGYGLALVTSSRRRPAEEKLRAAKLYDAFDVIITFDDIENPKPAADPYIKAALLLGHAPENCVVFEDSGPGATAGRRAGCLVVMIPDRHGSDPSQAHLVAENLWQGVEMAGLLPAAAKVAEG